MKLFQQLLVAPAALGLLAPLAANAAEVNINDVAAYSSSEQHVETTAQFSDVVPGDWAYTALQNLGESYGCVDNAYTQTLKSGQALTRYEAASLVNSCLEGLVANGQGLTQDAARLTNEFGSEMAILKGRVDGLEYRLNEYNAGQFASTTLMSGSAVFTTGAVQGSGQEKLHSVYSYGIDLSTSFSGDDSLDVGIVAGNAGTEPLLSMDSSQATANALNVETLSYTWPIGDFTVTAGPLMEEDQVISATLSTYSDAFYISNQPYTTGSSGNIAPGIGATYYAPESKWNASLMFLFEDGTDGASGIGTTEGDDTYIASIGYDADQWGGGVMIQNQDEKGGIGGSHTGRIEEYKAVGFGLYFSPDDANYRLSIGYDEQEYENDATADLAAWTTAIDYDGIGPGTLSAAYQSVDNQTDELFKAEVYYNWEIADGISVQPGVFVNELANADDEIGIVVETYFSF